MPNYSAGGGSGQDEGTTCELCGEVAEELQPATIAGARLVVCANCAPHGDTPGETDQDAQSAAGPTSDSSEATDREGTTSSQASGQNSSGRGSSPLWDSDTTHWEAGGVDYETDRLPYLVSEYGDRVQTAREAAGLTRADLAAELDVLETDLLAVEQGNAVTAGVGGSAISTLEAFLDVTLTE